MPAEHSYRHSTYTMRDVRPRRIASKVTRDDGAVVRFRALLTDVAAIEQARRMFEGSASFNGTGPAELEERIRTADSSNSVRRAVRDLLTEMARNMPADWEFAPAVSAAVERGHNLR